MDFYRNAAQVLRWFNDVLLEHMELYVEPTTGLYMLADRYHCDIVTTSRVYIDTTDGRQNILPPNAWYSPVVDWKVDRQLTAHYMNGRSTYTFDSFEGFLSYVKLVHATRDTIPFLKYKTALSEDHLSKLVDADSKPPAVQRIKRERIFISSS